jgi:hypothetical protein
MKLCTMIRITSMLPNGIVTGLKLLGINEVSDSHEYGMRQVAEPEISPVTGRPVSVYYPVLHAEGEATELLAGDSE